MEGITRSKEGEAINYTFRETSFLEIFKSKKIICVEVFINSYVSGMNDKISAKYF